ncbi:MAG: site-specific DNA-methyltransferase [Mesorhizobium sp.]|nr:MAG: site-specific DNA-methyltransferase [Mesorhizobium sp.]
MNKLFFGDNLDVLRRQIKDESVDLVYLDPPFNSNANYNVLFKEQEGIPSEAQAEAFRDTWGWGHSAAIAYDEVVRAGGDTGLLMRSLRSWLGDNAMMAYLAMMSVRLIELRRVLKPTGSLYLHCDPTASHYLKILLDAIFGHREFVSEIIWQRTNARGTTGRWPRLHDTILHFSASDKFVFNSLKTKANQAKLPHTLITGADGRKYQTFELTAPGVTKSGDSGKDWRGFSPTRMGRHWANNEAERNTWDVDGLIHWPARGGFPRRRAATPFEPEAREVVIGDVWTDIDRLNQTAKERLGYPTQKPIALLDRIIRASTNEDAVILDPFCGCGTTVEAAERLGRNWLGIDVTHYAVTLIERRLSKIENSSPYQVNGRPTDLAGARDLARRDKHQFQWWASWLLGAQTYESKKGADRGIDGNIYFANGPYGFGRIIVSVKGGEHLAPAMVRELSGVVQREEDANMGILVTLAEPTKAMLSDAAGAGFVERSAHGRLPRVQIVTVGDLLDGRYPTMPPLPPPAITRVRTKAARDRDQLELLLPFDADGPKIPSGAILDPRYLALDGDASRRSSLA